MEVKVSRNDWIERYRNKYNVFLKTKIFFVRKNKRLQTEKKGNIGFCKI